MEHLWVFCLLVSKKIILHWVLALKLVETLGCLPVENVQWKHQVFDKAARDDVS